MSRVIVPLVFVLVSCATNRAAEAPSQPGTEPAKPLSVTLDVQRADPNAPEVSQPAPVLLALKKELERSMAELASDGHEAPYFMSYAVSDDHTLEIHASFGGLEQSRNRHDRTFDIDVRVGSHQLDNSHDMGRGRSRRTVFRRRGSDPFPLDDDPLAIRTAVWLRTDAAYKRAQEMLARVKASKEVQVEEDDDSDDFSREEPSRFLEKTATLVVDKKAWEDRVRGYSALFRDHPELQSSSVRMVASATNRYFVNTEGALIQTARTHTRLMFSVEAKADDGMVLRRSETMDATSPDRLPSDAAIREQISRIVRDVLALRAAPKAEPSTGPAILDGRASAVYFHEIFGHRVEGHRQKSQHEGQTFAKKIGEQVMPDFINVYDDPTVVSLADTELNGTYRFDDEGIAAQRASLVEHGELVSFLMSRAPARGFTRSNGHGRRAPGRQVVARQGALIVHPERAGTVAELKAGLLEQIRAQGKPYGLRFVEVTGGYTGTSRYGPQAFTVNPVMVYRVYPDGREELVRGVKLEGTPLTSLSKVLAAADDFATFNGFCGAESGLVPVSAISPSLLIEQIEVARVPKSDRIPPLLAPPPLTPPQTGSQP